jgi:hypothetical protein
MIFGVNSLGQRKDVPDRIDVRLNPDKKTNLDQATA